MSARTTWPALLNALLSGESLTAEETGWAMSQIMAGAATDAQIAGFAVALRAKGETVAEVGGIAAGMLANATPLAIEGDLVDLVGTGGDQHHTVNFSTMAAIVAAGAGAKVVKHGNRAASSSCGTADVLEALGVVIDLPPAATEKVAAEAGIAFLFAPVYHPAFRYTAGPRRELGTPTVFNFLGPLTNPAHPRSFAVGVFHERMAPVLAGVFAARGSTGLVFRGEDGMDELSTTGPSKVWTVRDGEVGETVFDPAELGVPRATIADFRGADATFNAGVVHKVLAGEPGPIRDMVRLNAAAALVAAAGAPDPDGLVPALKDAYERAGEAIDSGAARNLLERWVGISQRHRPS
ncbi:anthranilate phosphoribosyltransferase [Actinocorallia herbida]|uniref:Anthranilate phosphoribosyltransferase n=1 Tax=Actinocorallia herbida TaxID=58109 RepID=A0A3N1CRJ4_9ACTN|nr:anthranilate phosphoribosyltransferase [Actinocorallia herbida]ROO83825.1 anthranilate phosphoribosyltransferase [Actinocorallia herbida]